MAKSKVDGNKKNEGLAQAALAACYERYPSLTLMPKALEKFTYLHRTCKPL
jgi:hypothetical protein